MNMTTEAAVGQPAMHETNESPTPMNSKPLTSDKPAGQLGLPIEVDTRLGANSGTENARRSCTERIGGKTVLHVETRILNPDSDFRDKLLCGGPTISAGSSCAYSCKYCYVGTMMDRGGSAVSEALRQTGKRFSEVVIRRTAPLETLRAELRDSRGRLRYADDSRVVYASPAVDVAATVELARETISLCLEILASTGWTIRLLSKSPLILAIAEAIPPRWKHRVIYAVSTGTLDDTVAKAIEPDAPAPSKRLEALKRLQDQGCRTFAMLCPILPQDPVAFATDAAKKINFDACEHVWAEVLNRRGASMQHTADALDAAGIADWAAALRRVFGPETTEIWEGYARSTFAALTAIVPPGKLRFLQYVTHSSVAWWSGQRDYGAIALGKAAKPIETPEEVSPELKAKRSAAARKAWETIRAKRALRDHRHAQPPTA